MCACPSAEAGTQYAAASRFNHKRLWNTGSPAFAGDDNRICVRDLAARCARSFENHSPPEIKRAQGMPDARCTRGLACKGVVEAHTSIQGSGEHPTFPAQWLYGLWRDLPGERLFC